MSIIVRDDGFHSDDWSKHIHEYNNDIHCEHGEALHIENDVDLKPLENRLNDYKLIRVNFPNFADGRGFSIARQLRLAGFKGRLRAFGHILADQYAMARNVGFDEVEISKNIANRQPEDQWRFRANTLNNNYQDRLKGS